MHVNVKDMKVKPKMQKREEFVADRGILAALIALLDIEHLGPQRIMFSAMFGRLGIGQAVHQLFFALEVEIRVFSQNAENGPNGLVAMA